MVEIRSEQLNTRVNSHASTQVNDLAAEYGLPRSTVARVLLSVGFAHLKEVRTRLTVFKENAGTALSARAQREKALIRIGQQWLAENPDHCPECFCRPGHGDAEDGSDHEGYCTHRPEALS